MEGLTIFQRVPMTKIHRTMGLSQREGGNGKHCVVHSIHALFATGKIQLYEERQGPQMHTRPASHGVFR
jgi:hypothetical protein